jgi:hypothetical protein
MKGRLSRRARARQAMRIQAQISCAVRDLDSHDEHVRAEAVRKLCPCRTHMHWTLERYVVPMLHDTSPLVRFAANFVLSEELENEMVKAARTYSQDRDAGSHC